MQADNAGTRPLQNDTLSGADYEHSEININRMSEKDTQIQHRTAVRTINELFYQDIKSQHDIARKTASSSFAGRPRRKAKKNVPTTSNFDIKIRNFVYSGVPEES